MSHQVSVLFVCLGNICRSPTAHGIFEGLVKQQGLEDKIYIDSAGTGDWHIGREPDHRAQSHAAKRGYDLSHLRARQFRSDDFNQYDYILAMDSQNYADMKAQQLSDYQGYFGLFLDFLEEDTEAGEGQEVPDPYYGGEDGFELVLDMVEQASENLLAQIKSKLV